MLSITWIYLSAFFTSSASLQRWFSCSLCECLCYNLESLFHKKQSNKHKTSGVIIIFSVLGKVSFIFYWQEMIGNSLNKHWLDLDLRRRKKDGYLAQKKVAPNLLWRMKSESFWLILFTNLFLKLHPLMCMYWHFLNGF